MNGKGPQGRCGGQEGPARAARGRDVPEGGGRALRGQEEEEAPQGRLLFCRLVGGGIALALSEGLRKKVLDALFGAEEEFEYTASTTPDANAARASPSAPPRRGPDQSVREGACGRPLRLAVGAGRRLAGRPARSRAAMEASVADPRRLEGEKAQRIIAAMRSSVGTRGAAGSTFDHVAREAGVSRGLLHYYFGSKERLLVEVVRHDCEVRNRAGRAARRGAQRRRDRRRARGRARGVPRGRRGGRPVLYEMLSASRHCEEIRAELAELYRRGASPRRAGCAARSARA